MKRILLLISLVLCFFTGWSQFVQNPTQGGIQIKQTNLGAIEAQRGIKGGSFVDTTAANAVPYMKGVSGIMIYTTSDDNYWYRSFDISRWILFSSGSSSNCLGTRLISGFITWSGVGYVYDATDHSYYIGCNSYFASATTLTLSTADPSYPRIDKFIADTLGVLSILTGTPATNPQEPTVNPLSQIDLGFVYVPAGSTVPPCTAVTSIYNENSAGEWAIASDATVNTSYATNPCYGSVSTLVSGVSNNDFVSWQSGSPLTLSDYPYTKLYVKLNAALAADVTFLSASFYLGATQVSSAFNISDGVYGFDITSTSCQLLTLPNFNLTYANGATFDKIVFVINGAPASFQLDRIYMLSCAYVPPTPANSWLERGNTGTDPDSGDGVGTADSVDHAWITNGQIRARMPADGINLIEYSDTTKNVMVIDTVTKKIYRAKFPTAYGTSPIVIVRDIAGNATYITCPTCVTTASWSLTGNAGTTAGTNFIGTTDDVDVVFKRNSIKSGIIGSTITSYGDESLLVNSGTNNTAFGADVLKANSSGVNNTAIGRAALITNTTGSQNVAVGVSALTTALASNNVAVGVSAGGSITLIGTGNTFIGNNSDAAANTTDSSIALGYKAVSASKQFAISPYINQIKATGFTTSAGRVLTDVAGNGILTLEVPAGGSQTFYQTTVTGSTLAGNVNLDLNSNKFELSDNVLGGNVFSADAFTGVYGLGDLDAGANGTKISITDATNKITATADTIRTNAEVINVINANADLNILTTATSQGIFNDSPASSSFSLFNSSTANSAKLWLHASSASEIQANASDDSTHISMGSSGDEGILRLSQTSFRAKIYAQSGGSGGTGSSKLWFPTVTAIAGNTWNNYLPKASGVLPISVNGAVADSAGAITGVTAATLTTPRLINGVSFNGSADIAVTNKILAYQALGSTIIATNVDGDLASGVSGQALTDARCYFSAVYLDKAQTVTGVKWVQITAGDYTADNYNGVGLYSYSGGTLTLVASSTDDGNIWKATTGTMSSKAFTTPYSAVAGVYFVAHIYNNSAQTTAPSLGIINSASTVNTVTDFTNSAKTSGLVSSLTTLPSPTQASSGISAAATEYKVFLY